MTQEQIFTLARAQLELEKFLDKNKHVDERTRLLLSDIVNRIKSIQHIQRGWLKAETQYAYHLVQPESGRNLSAKMSDAQKKTMGFTWVTVRQLLKDLSAIEIKSEDQQYSDLLSLLKECFEAVLTNLEESLTINPNTNLADFDRIDGIRATDTDADSDYINIFNDGIESIGGRIANFQQSRDPLNGQRKSNNVVMESSGTCNGYVKSWCKEIAESGCSQLLPRLDLDTYKLQYQSTDTFIPSRIWHYEPDTDFRKITESIINHLDANKTFGLQIYPSATHIFGSGHVIGIRSIPSHNAYEIFDPNFGMMVFNNKDSVICFFAWYLCNAYFDIFVSRNTTNGDLRLYEYGTQPSFSKPSIPVEILTNSTEIPDNIKNRLETLNQADSFMLKDIAKQRNSLIKSGADRNADLMQVGGIVGGSIGFSLGSTLTTALLLPPAAPLAIGVNIAIFLAGIGLGVGASKTNTARVIYEECLAKTLAGMLYVISSLSKSDDKKNDQPRHAASLNQSTINIMTELRHHSSPNNIVSKAVSDKTVSSNEPVALRAENLSSVEVEKDIVLTSRSLRPAM